MILAEFCLKRFVRLIMVHVSRIILLHANMFDFHSGSSGVAEVFFFFLKLVWSVGLDSFADFFFLFGLSGVYLSGSR
jgi:hypothetical protein